MANITKRQSSNISGLVRIENVGSESINGAVRVRVAVPEKLPVSWDKHDEETPEDWDKTEKDPEEWEYEDPEEEPEEWDNTEKPVDEWDEPEKEGESWHYPVEDI